MCDTVLDVWIPNIGESTTPESRKHLALFRACVAHIYKTQAEILTQPARAPEIDERKRKSRRIKAALVYRLVVFG